MRDIKEIRRLVKLLETSNLGLIELEEGDEKIRLAKKGTKNQALDKPRKVEENLSGELQDSKFLAEEQDLPDNIKVIKSTMIGTIFITPAPDARPLVIQGDQVEEDQILCFVETMGIRNEVKSEFAGEIVEIFVSDTQTVEYDQPLFAIRVNGLEQK